MLVENPREKKQKPPRQLKKRDPIIGLILLIFIFAVARNVTKEVGGVSSYWFPIIVILVAVGLFMYWFAFKRHNKIVEEQTAVTDMDLKVESAVNYSYNFSLALLMTGEKKYQLSGVIFYEINYFQLPQIGDTISLTGFKNNPLIEIKTLNISEYKLKNISFSSVELSLNPSITYWRQFYQQGFTQDLARFYVNTGYSQNLFGGINGIEIKASTENLNVPVTSQEWGIHHRSATEDFMVIYEEIEIVKIYPQTYQQWLDFAEETLREMLHKDPYATPKLDATLLLQFVTQRDKSAFIAYPDTELNAEQLAQLATLLVRRATGEPMAYILGETDFWTLNLAVSKATLIPRPDTEMLVEKAVELLKQRKNSPHFLTHFDGEISVLDLGTGTGAIALSIASELKKCGVKFKVFGVDLIADAVALAKQNGLRNNLPEVEFYQSSWFDNVSGKFDMIVSNPPYIDPQDPHLAQGDVRFEPLTALIAEEQGYADLRQIIEQAPAYLKPEGYLLLEHGWQQGEKVRSIFAENLWVDIATLKDYGDNERVTLARL